MNLNEPLSEATNYLRRLICADPEMPTELGKATVISIDEHDRMVASAVMEVALDDGTTIRLSVSRYKRDGS